MKRVVFTRSSLIAAAFLTGGHVFAADLAVPVDHPTLQAAVLAAQNGDRIVLADGTYVLGTTLQVNKSITIEGQTRAGTVINAAATGAGWGINVSVGDVTLKNFTVLPPAGPGVRGTSGGGAFAIHAGYNTTNTTPNNGLTIQDISIDDSNRSAFDIHGFDNVTLSGLSATDAAYGNGIQLSGCTNVTITGCTTSGNAWGGIAVYASKSADLNRPSSTINFDFAANNVAENFYIEKEQGLASTANITGTTYQIDNAYGPPAAAMAYYTNGDLAKATGLAQGLNTKYSNSASVLSDSGGNTLVLPGLGLQAAIDAASPGETITLSGTITLTSPVTLNKQLTLDGGDNTTTQISGSNALGGRFITTIGSSGGSIIKNISFIKTDKAGVQALIGLQSPDVVVEDCDFSGQYVLGDADVSRAFEISSTGSGFRIEDCSFTGLRQPAYINAVSSGSVLNNYVAGTRGWVVDGALVDFTGNTWSGNAVDIALLDGTPASPLYDPLSALSARNSGAVISNQRSAQRVNNTTKGILYPTIQAAINAADNGDSLEVYPGTYAENVTLGKDLDVVGAGSATTTVSGSGTIFAITSGGSGASVSGIATTGGARGFNLNGVSNVVLENVASTGNSSFGINFDGASSGVTLRNSSFSNNTSSGIKVPSAGRVSNLTIDACTVNGNKFGLYSADRSAGTYANAQLEGITANNGTTFSNNWGKGIFIESMNNGLFENITVSNSGTGPDGGTGSGIDINLKYGTYSNLTIRNSLVSNCGQNYSFGGGILVKARNDGAYAAIPATLGGTVLLEGLRVENCGGAGNGAGIRVGDSPVNVSPSNVVIRNSALLGNNQYAVLNLVTGATVEASLNHWGATSGPVAASSNGVGGNVNFNPWYASGTASVPPVLSTLTTGIPADTEVDTVQPNVPNLYIAPGLPVTITPTGGLSATNLQVAEGGTLVVNGGSLTIGSSTISGSFTIFNSFGSWHINGNTTFNISQSLALVTDVHVAAGVTLTVNGGGELILDGCVIDSKTPGTPYTITAAADGLLTMARCVVSDASIDINTSNGSVAANLKSKVYDNSFTASEIEATADAAVYHNLFDAATDAASPGPFAAVDGWSNITSIGDANNRFSLEFAAPVPSLVGRTLAAGNLFVQSGDQVVIDMDVSALDPDGITAAEALLGYNSDLLNPTGSPTVVAPAEDWDVVVETEPVGSTGLGLVDSALGLEFDFTGTSVTADSNIASVTFQALAPGATLGFFRVQTNGEFDGNGQLLKDTRLTKFTAPSTFSLTTPFTSNTGELVIDDADPAIATPAVSGTQVQPSAGSVNVLLPTTNFVLRNGTPVILTFTATDSGLSGLDAADATSDLSLVASDGVTTLNSSNYTVAATELAGTVTYTVSLIVPPAATTGEYDVTATVRDRSGNVSPVANLATFQVANESIANVELEGFKGTSRQVAFVATDASGVELDSWLKTVTFTTVGFNGVGSVALENVPAGTARISAKTAWTLRSRVDTTFSGTGVNEANFTGAKLLKAGDITGDNVVNTLDYSTLRFSFATVNPVADIDGGLLPVPGVVNSTDYNLMQANFYSAGDAK
ncbi:beta strand repeat-containing protein [Luteolibacter sp. Populi]|uniref:beta strand repeat-containing protein n=1 Tax=Luteolibacter sp. Populi TaxID=3230487 RepID=UPI00346683C6